jgi:hypothetical protein
MVLRVNDGENHISILDEQDNLLTDTDRQKNLFGDGYRYEACSAQALMVETLCSMYMGLQHQAYGMPMLDMKGRNVGIEGKATFGRVVNLLTSSNAFHKEGIEADLKEYVELRNSLAHEVSGTSSNFNFHTFFELGEKIVKELKPHFEKTFEKIISKPA